MTIDFVENELLERIKNILKDKKLKALKIGFIKITGQSIIELKNGDTWVA